MRSLVCGLLLGAFLLLTGCVDTSVGTILGVLTYFSVAGETSFLIPNGFVALYTAADTTTPLEVQPTDDLGRFNFQLEEGMYALAGSTLADGPYTGTTGPIEVQGHRTTQIIFSAFEPTPDAPVVTSVTVPPVFITTTASTFNVSAVEGVRFYWNFGGGATPNESTDLAPTVTAGVPGTYTGTVIAANDDGTALPFPFEYTVVTVTAGNL